MKTIYVSLSIGYQTATHEDEIEVEDDATDEDKDQVLQDWAANYVETSWSDTKPQRRWR